MATKHVQRGHPEVWQRPDKGSTPGKASFKNHACDGGSTDYQARPWGADKGNVNPSRKLGSGAYHKD